MKSLNILTASAVALASFALAGTAMSQTVIRITGATTYRAPLHKAITDSLQSGYTLAYDSTTTSATAFYGASAAIFKGNLASTGDPVIIKTYFSGSLAGVVDLTLQSNIAKWIPTSATTSTGGGTNVAGAYTPETAPAQGTLTDAFASSAATAVAGGGGAGSTAAQAIRKATLTNAGVSAGTAGTVGIVPFVWVLGKVSTAAGVPTYTYTVNDASGAPVTKTGTQFPFGNITQQQAASLSQGPTAVSSFTASSADKDKYVFLVGRNEDSGTRIGALAEAQTGFSGGVVQYQPTFSGTSTTGSGPTPGSTIPTGGAVATVNGADLWPANSPLNTNNSINWNTSGHSGYVAGGDVANVLKATNPVTLSGTFSFANLSAPENATHAYFVGYLGVSDGATASASGFGTQLNYNGVAYSAANVKNGSYSFWALEHLYYLGSGAATLTGVAKTALDVIADRIYTTTADTTSNGTTGGGTGAGIVIDSTVLVNRQKEGGVLSPTY